MPKQFDRVKPHAGEVWTKAWCAYIESGMAKKSDTAATTATIFADAALEDYLKRFPDKKAPEPAEKP